MNDRDVIELEAAGGEAGIDSADDLRPRLVEPPPVRLVAVADVTLAATSGVEVALDDFYAGLLEFEREEEPAGDERGHGASRGPVYVAENHRILFVMHERPAERATLRPLGIEVRSLAVAEAKLVEREMRYLRQGSLTPGMESLLLRDPAGNWVELVEARAVG